MKLFLGIIKSEYIKWIKSDKQLMTAFSMIFLYMYSLEIINKYTLEVGEPINIFEPLAIFMSNFYIIPILVLTFAVLMIDFPDISANSTFMLIRAGRTRWYKGQVIFVYVAAASFIGIFFVYTAVVTQSNAFVANLWSNAERFVNGVSYSDFRSQNPMAYLDLSIINNYTVFAATVYGVVLMVMHLALSSQLQMVLSLRFNKMIGLLGNAALLALGMVSWWADSGIKWLFPLAHSTVVFHYDELFNKVNFPISGSFLYLAAVNLLLYFIGRRVMKHKMLTLLDNAN